MGDPVNHPDHYTQGDIECFDAIRASQGDQAAIDFAICNAMKYIWRHKLKEDPIQDLEKAQQYLNKAIDILKENN